MALVLKDRVKETTTTTGTGTVTLAGAVTGFQSFSVIGNGNTTYYCITDNTNWEVGIGTYTSAGTTLSRTTVFASSNSNNLVNWGVGSKDVFVTYPSARQLNTGETNSATAPASPREGQIWYDTTNGVMLVYYNSQWIEDYQSQLSNTITNPDMDGGTASTTTWTYSIDCGAAT